MATPLTRRVVRETTLFTHRRPTKPILVCLEEGGKLMRLWVKGERTKYTVSIQAVYELGARIRLEEIREEKRNAKLERRKLKGR